MKRKLLKILSLMSVAFFCLISTKKVNADDNIDYKLENDETTAKVNADGSLNLTQKIRYKFEDNAHGVYYLQTLEDDQRIKTPSVTIKGDRDKTSSSATYDLYKFGDVYRFKVYKKIHEGEHFSVTYHYKITNAITNYRDVAELNFMIIGDNWQKNIGQVRATVIFPGPVKTLKAWAHGPLDGHIAVEPKNGKIVMTVNNLGQKTGVEVHAIFPLSVTPKNKKIVNKNHRQSVLKQEAALAKAANEKRNKRNILDLIFVVIGLFFGIIAIIRGFTAKKHGVCPKTEGQLEHNYEVPDVDPVRAQILDTSKFPNVEAFTAYIMFLAVKKKLKIEDYKEKSKIYYRITATDPTVFAENEVLTTLFTVIGDGKAVTTQQLKKYKGKELNKGFYKWTKDEYFNVFDDGLLSAELTHYRNTVLEIIILSLVISFGAAVVSFMRIPKYGSVIFLVEAILLFLGIYGLIRSNVLTSKYTQKGADETNKVRGFKKMFNDVGRFEMRDIGDLILWQEIMPYAVAFGLAKKVLKELKIEFGDDKLERSGYGYYGPFFISGSNGFTESFSSSFAGSVSYGSGSSGGFSGGSSGGFGGGSGGGAF